MSNKDILKRGPSDKIFKPKDYDVLVSQIEDPDEVVNTILARLKLASEFREPFEKLWRRAFMAWMQMLDTEKETSWESKRFLPLILQQIETALPILYSAVFNGPHIWQFHGMTPEGRNAADALDKLIHWQANGPSKMRPEFDQMNFFALLFGTGIIDTAWSDQEDFQWVPKVVEDVDDEGELTGEKVKVLAQETVKVEDWPVLRNVNPLEFWPAPHGRMGDGLPWGVERIETTVGEVIDAAGGGHLDKDAIKEWLDEWNGDENEDFDGSELFEGANVDLWDEWFGEADLEERRYNSSDDVHIRDKVVFLLEYRSRTERITIAPGRKIIGYSENPYLHKKTGYIIHQYIPIPGSPFGRGLGTILLGHQELANENINLYMDTARISLMAPIIVNRSSMNPLDKNVVWTPNKIIHARDVNNAARRMDVPAPTDLAFNLQAHIGADAELTTGFSKQSAGVASSQVGTATEAQALQQNLATRTIMHVIRLRETVTQIGQILVSLNQQFMTEEQIVAVVGEDGMDYHTVQPWQVVGQVHVQSVASATRANPAMRAQQLIGAMQVFLPILQQGGMTPVIGRLLRTLLKTIEVEDVDLIIPKAALTTRDPMVENVALETGVPVQPSEFEDFATHMQTHATRRAELEAEGAPQSILGYFDQHMMATSAMAAQKGQQQAQQQAQQDGLGGERPGGQQATGLGAAAGNQGVAGEASPGPAAAPGRPA